MMIWLSQNISTIVVGGMVFFILFLSVRKTVQQWISKKGFCTDSCVGCSLTGICTGSQPSFVERYRQDQLKMNEK